MENYKIELWEGEVPNIEILKKESIEKCKIKLCSNFFRKKINEPECRNFYELFSKYEKYISDIENIKNIDFYFLLRKCNKGVFPKYLYLDFGNFEKIYKISAEDFIRNINNIWYPSSDDLSIFNELCNWVLTIHHEGSMGCATPNDIVKE